MAEIHKLVEIAREAGQAIMEIYGSADHQVTYKDDRSPLTAADQASHEIIAAALTELTPDIPVLSEEGKALGFEERRPWTRFWLVDPLDGTKEFIHRRGEFTVNIALIDHGQPERGVIFIPARGTLYWASPEGGAWKQQGDQEPVEIHVTEPPDPQQLRVVASRSHRSEKDEAFLSRYPVGELIPAGSSLKFCAVADGTADLYPRMGPTWEWDTGAGHALVLAAGGVVVDLDGHPLKYNKPSLKHDHFVVHWGGLTL